MSPRVSICLLGHLHVHELQLLHMAPRRLMRCRAQHVLVMLPEGTREVHLQEIMPLTGLLIYIYILDMLDSSTILLFVNQSTVNLIHIRACILVHSLYIILCS